MSPRTHLRTPCREKERNARCEPEMLARSCTERDSGFQRTKNVPARRDELSSISCPTQWTPCHRARTSAFCRARRKCDLPPSESLWPVPRLVTKKSTIYCKNLLLPLHFLLYRFALFNLMFTKHIVSAPKLFAREGRNENRNENRKA